MISKALVHAILTKAENYEWSIQGFGMLRMYPDGTNKYRLNVWDTRFRFPNVSMIHNHPWDFESLILAGEVRQYRYVYSSPEAVGKPFYRQKIRTGEGGGMIEEESEVVALRREPMEIYGEGQKYKQEAQEIHISLPVDGTVTINDRTFVSKDSNAFVFWPVGEEWVTAEPRPATKREIRTIVNNSLKTWF